jgi:branched-chain amino acid transport system permease protein
LSLGFWSFVGVLAGIYAIFALGLQVQFGYTGLSNFGHVGSMTVAAYTMAVLIIDAHMATGLAALAGILMAVVFSLVIGGPTLRLRGDYLAITTLAFAEIVRYIADNEERLGGPAGSIGLQGLGQAAYYNTAWENLLGAIENWLAGILGPDFASRDIVMMGIVWSTALALIVLVRAAIRSPWGRVLKSIKEDEDAASALGKNVFWYKMQALALGSALAGVAGVFYALQYQFFSPADFVPLVTFYAWIIMILGGIGRLWGVALGAIILTTIIAGTRFLDFPPLSYLGAADRAYLRLLIVGLILLGLMVFRPQGIFGSRREMVLE